jgi:hypothetical protein
MPNAPGAGLVKDGPDLRRALRSDARVGPAVSFTVSLPLRARRLPRVYRCGRDAGGMADVLVIAGIVVFVAAMLGLIWGLERV